MGMVGQAAALSRHGFNHTRSDGSLMAGREDRPPYAMDAICPICAAGATGAAGATAAAGATGAVGTSGAARARTAGAREPARPRAAGTREPAGSATRGRGLWRTSSRVRIRPGQRSRTEGGKASRMPAIRPVRPMAAGDTGLLDTCPTRATGRPYARHRAPSKSRRRDPGHDRQLVWQIGVLSTSNDLRRLLCFDRTFYPVQRLHHTTGGNYPQAVGANTPSTRRPCSQTEPRRRPTHRSREDASKMWQRRGTEVAQMLARRGEDGSRTRSGRRTDDAQLKRKRDTDAVHT
jgi:hypothetical protein